MQAYIEQLIGGNDLAQSDMRAAMDLIMGGDVPATQIAAFLVALRAKGETVDEVAGGAASMRAHAVAIDAGDLAVVDTCGTGGDGSGTFNISTAAALVTAGAGVPVAKHGNKAMSSQCGSADVLAELGVNLEAGPEQVADCIRQAGIGFLFAPMMHPAMKFAGPVRRELGIRTVFNMLGPLTNPAGARRQVIGTFDASLTELFAGVLRALGSERAFCVHGNDGLDEISTTTTTRVSELRDGEIETYEFDPRPLIGNLATPDQLAGGDAAANAAIIRDVLGGKKSAGRDIVCLNAAAAIVAGGVAGDMQDGYAAAQASIDSGKATDALAALVKTSA